MAEVFDPHSMQKVYTPNNLLISNVFKPETSNTWPNWTKLVSNSPFDVYIHNLMLVFNLE